MFRSTYKNTVKAILRSALFWISLVVLADILLHIYVIGWGGVEGLSLGAYLLDSTLRLISLTLAMSLPCVLFFVGLTYMVGTLFKSGVVGALAGFGYIIAFMALLFFKVTLVKMHNIKAAEVYYGYFSHIPDKLGHYCHAIGREDGQRIMAMMDTSLGEAAVALAMLLGLFVLFAAVICWRTKKREV